MTLLHIQKTWTDMHVNMCKIHFWCWFSARKFVFLLIYIHLRRPPLLFWLNYYSHSCRLWVIWLMCHQCWSDGTELSSPNGKRLTQTSHLLQLEFSQELTVTIKQLPACRGMAPTCLHGLVEQLTYVHTRTRTHTFTRAQHTPTEACVFCLPYSPPAAKSRRAAQRWAAGALTAPRGGQGHNMPAHCAVRRRQLFKITLFSPHLFKCKCLVGTFFRLFASAVEIRAWKHRERGGATGMRPRHRAPTRRARLKGYIVSTSDLWLEEPGQRFSSLLLAHLRSP